MILENLNLPKGDYIATIDKVVKVTNDTKQELLQVFWHIESFGQRVAVVNNFLASSCSNKVQCVTEHLKDSKEYYEIIRLKKDDEVCYFEVSDDGAITLLFAISEDDLFEETLYDEDTTEYEYDFDALAAL